MEPMNTSSPAVLSAEQLVKGFDYQSYIDHIRVLFDAGKASSMNENPAMLEYTKQNLYRMKRLDKQVVISDSMNLTLQELPRKLTWMILAEGWCGDAAQNIPVLAKIADASDKISLKILLRDANPEVMDAFLTNGGRAIPKLVALDTATHEVLGTWGPRPVPAQQIGAKVREAKEKYGPASEEVRALQIEMQKWYNDDLGQTLQQEMAGLLKQWTR